MKLSISNIAWQAKEDEKIYALMGAYGYSGLEIAPTRIFPQSPYDKLEEAGRWAAELKKRYGFSISSMQSIWHGRSESIFGTEAERRAMADYTKKAVDFASMIGCCNLVFGCPRNRNIPDGADPAIAIPFFKEIGDYAFQKNTVIAMEANPPIYNTNYINDTLEAFELIEKVDSKGFLLNLDVGTMIQNGESTDILRGKVRSVNHVHISEPGLTPIQKRNLHADLKELLLAEGYQGYVSVEMGKTENFDDVVKAIKYVREVFE